MMAREVSCSTVNWCEPLLGALIEPGVGDGPGGLLAQQGQQRHIFVAEGAARRSSPTSSTPSKSSCQSSGTATSAAAGRRLLLRAPAVHLALLRGGARQPFAQLGAFSGIERRAVGPARFHLQHAIRQAPEREDAGARPDQFGGAARRRGQHAAPVAAWRRFPLRRLEQRQPRCPVRPPSKKRRVAQRGRWPAPEAYARRPGSRATPARSACQEMQRRRAFLLNGRLSSCSRRNAASASAAAGATAVAHRARVLPASGWIPRR